MCTWKDGNVLNEEVNLRPADPSSEIVTTKLFDKSFSKLKLTSDDLTELKDSLKSTAPRAGYGYGIYKHDFWPKRFHLNPHEGRVIYILIKTKNTIYLFDIYKKNRRVDIEDEKIDLAKEFAQELNKGEVTE